VTRVKWNKRRRHSSTLDHERADVNATDTDGSTKAPLGDGPLRDRLRNLDLVSAGATKAANCYNVTPLPGH
jgi:hypothetical protein